MSQSERMTDDLRHPCRNREPHMAHTWELALMGFDREAACPGVPVATPDDLDTPCHCGDPAAIDVAHHYDRPCVRHPRPVHRRAPHARRGGRMSQPDTKGHLR